MNAGGDIVTALVFPGQGERASELLDSGFAGPDRAGRQAIVRAALAGAGENATTSLAALLTSAEWLDVWRERGGREDFYAGYSVGQWTALYAAGVVSFEATVAVVKRRAELMDAAQAGAPGAMLAVIGLAEPALRSWLAEFNAAGGHDLAISNFNSLGQYSLAGSVAAVEAAAPRLATLAGVRKAVRLPVAGAWHCSRLEAACAPFAAYLENVALGPAARPVWDNVTGEPLPEEPAALRRQLVRHLAEPVRWSDCVKSMAARGARRFVEVGRGDTLTKFGVFIERGCAHEALAPARRAG